MGPHDEIAVLLAHPAKVGHWVGNSDLRSQLVPEITEQQITALTSGAAKDDWWYVSHTCHLVVDDGSSIARYPGRKKDGIFIGVL